MIKIIIFSIIAFMVINFLVYKKKEIDEINDTLDDYDINIYDSQIIIDRINKSNFKINFVRALIFGLSLFIFIHFTKKNKAPMKVSQPLTPIINAPF